jgi:hypothetical protein
MGSSPVQMFSDRQDRCEVDKTTGKHKKFTTDWLK